MKKFSIALIVLALLLFPFSFGEAPFVSMPNPWKEADSEIILNTLGLSFGLPENSENVTYFMNEGLSLAEMRFSVDGTEYTARIMPANEFTDISGLYYGEWTLLETRALGYLENTYFTASDGDNTVHLCLWYDAAPGLMYSLSCITSEPIDLLAVSEGIYLPTQGECDVSFESLYADLIFSLTGYQGTAGASLKEACAAKNALEIALQYPVNADNIDSVRAAILLAYDALDEERKSEFLSNLPSVNVLLETAFSSFESVKGVFDDAGIAEEILPLLENEHARDLWTEFFAAFVILYTPVG